MAGRSVATKAPSWLEPIKKWVYNASGFNKYGLRHDDVLYEDDDVQEAVRRLPEHLRNERTFRLVRAMQLELQHTVLPKDQWTKYEEDLRYLQPILDEVKKERKEKEEWNKNH